LLGIDSVFAKNDNQIYKFYEEDKSSLKNKM